MKKNSANIPKQAAKKSVGAKLKGLFRKSKGKEEAQAQSYELQEPKDDLKTESMVARSSSSLLHVGVPIRSPMMVVGPASAYLAAVIYGLEVCSPKI